MEMIKIIVVVAVAGLLGWIGYDWYMGSNAVEELPVEEEETNELTGDEIYKWKDRSGVVHYTNDPETIPESARSLVKTVELPNLNEFDENTAQDFMKTGIGSDLPTMKTIDSVSDTNRVLFYSVKWCPNCKKVRDLLNKYGVIYAEYDVEKQIVATQSLAQLTGGNNVVPVVSVGGVVVVGYQPDRLYSVLKKQNKIRKTEEY